jgi:hypothetical protein
MPLPKSIDDYLGIHPNCITPDMSTLDEHWEPHHRPERFQDYNDTCEKEKAKKLK